MVSANISLSRRFLALTSIFSTAFDLLSNPPKNIVFTILSINYHTSTISRSALVLSRTLQKREKIEFGEKWHTENSIRIECFGTAAASFVLLFCFSLLQVSMVARESFLILHLWLFSVEGKFLSSFAVDGTKSKIIGQSVKQNFDYLLQQTVIF